MSLPPDMQAAPAKGPVAPKAAAPRSAAPAAPAKVPTGKRAPAANRKKPNKPRRPLLRPGLLPATILAAGLLIGVKVGDIWVSVTTGAAFNPVPASVAEEQAPQGLPEKAGAAKLAVPAQVVQVAQAATPPAAAPDAHAKEGAAHAPNPPASPAPAVEQAGGGHDATPSGAPGQSFTPKEVEILQRLQERREQLDQRARELDMRDAMLVAAESRFDQKIAELQKLKQEIQSLLTTVNSEQQTQLDSLVKIYETMKPADAAKIFNSLENKVLLNVISRMKEAKAAPVLAAMDSARAQEVTILLAERKRLPTVPE
jgi:flagellar motility protein MotE (MotC chaperone)